MQDSSLERIILRKFEDVGALSRKGHFELPSGDRHSGDWVNKDELLRHPRLLAELCVKMATPFADFGIDVVAGSDDEGLILSHFIALALSSPKREVQAVTAGFAGSRGGYRLRHGADGAVKGKRVLLVQGIIMNHETAQQTMLDITQCGGSVDAYSVLWDRNAGHDTTIQDVVERHFTLLTTKIHTWKKSVCSLCREGVPVMRHPRAA